MRRLTSGRRRQDFARAQNDIQTVSVARIKRHEKHIQRVSKKPTPFSWEQKRTNSNNRGTQNLEDSNITDCCDSLYSSKVK